MTRLTLLLAFVSAHLLAQSPATLSGRVRDAQGAPIPGAALRLFRQDTNTSFAAATERSGEYRFERLEPGSFVLEVSKDGFRTTTLALAVHRESMSADVTLEVAGVNQSVLVTAAGEAQTLDEVSKAA